jgi:hypothetical protein
MHGFVGKSDIDCLRKKRAASCASLHCPRRRSRVQAFVSCRGDGLT